MPRGRSIFGFMLKAFAMLLFCVLAVAAGFELYLRQAGYLKAQPANYPCVTGDPVLNHVFQKSCEGVATAEALKTEKDVTYKFNSLGIRGQLPGEGAYRLVVIGDSYTEGFGLAEDETFPAQLESALKQKGMKGLEVLNGGTLGYSPAFYPIYFERYFSDLRPNFVLLNLDFTDFTDIAYHLQIADYDESGSPVAFPARDTFPEWLLPYVYGNRSALLRFIHQEWNQAYLIGLRKEKQPVMDQLVSSDPRIFSEEDIKQFELQGCTKSVEAVARLVLELRRRVEAAGGRFGVHMYPPGHMVKSYPPGQQNISFVQKWDQLTRKDYSWACTSSLKMADAIAAFAERQGFPFFSSVPFVLSHPEKEQLYFERDAHWNSRGVKEITERLAAPLQKALETGK